MEHTFLPTGASTPTDSDSLSQLLTGVQQSQPQQIQPQPQPNLATVNLYLPLSLQPPLFGVEELAQLQYTQQAAMEEPSQPAILTSGPCLLDSAFGRSTMQRSAYANGSLMDANSGGGFSAEPLAVPAVVPGNVTTPDGIFCPLSTFVSPVLPDTSLPESQHLPFPLYLTSPPDNAPLHPSAAYGYSQPPGSLGHQSNSQLDMAVSVSSVSGFPASSLLLTSSLHHVPAPPCSSSVFPPEMAGAAQVPALCTPAPGSTPEIAADGSAQSSSGHTGRRHEASPPLQLYATLQNEADAITDASSAYLCAGSWDHGRGTQDGSRSGSATTPTPLALGAAYELSPLFDGAAPDSVADMDMATDDNSSNGVAASRGRRSNRRTTLSTRQKREFYVWLANNTDTPYPSEEDRLGCLNIDNMDKKKFGYWFANIRSRQFDKVRTPDGRRQFVPNAKFYGTCRRLRIGIPATVPEDSIGLA